MPNYKLIIQYKGSNYAGWQIQKNAVTVQQVLTEAIKKISREQVNLIGSGRTDTGVHALGQTANFKIENELNTYKFKHSLNSVLPPDIAVIDICEADENFHARFDAKKRSYIYLFSKIKSPFYNDFAYHVNRIDEQFIEKANKLGKSLLGNHDFTSFSKKNSEVRSKICNVYDIHWRMSGPIIYFYIEADRYLHGMVRTIVGTISEGVRKNCSENYLMDILDKKDREAADMAVPAHGLFLYKVKY